MHRDTAKSKRELVLLSVTLQHHTQSASAIYRAFAAMQVLMRRLSAVRQRTSNTAALPPTFTLCTVAGFAISLTDTGKLPVIQQIHPKLRQF